jgi:hypothetical protein
LLSYPSTHALDRFTFNGITLPKFAYGPYLQITADCTDGDNNGHCDSTPSYVEPQVCPSGYVQVSYDKCCVSPGSSDCYDATLPPTSPPTPQPTFHPDSNLVLNPGFEDDDLTYTWYANSGTIELNNTEAHSGYQSVLAKDRTATWNAPRQNMWGRLFAGNTYRVSCWAKLKGTTSSDRLKLTLEIVDDGIPKWPGVATTINNIDWTLVEGDILVDVVGELTGISLFAEGPAAGVEYWVDDVSVVAV